MRTIFTRLAVLALVLMFVLSACGGQPAATEEAASGEPFVFGILLVGPYNDNGWSQAHYEAGKYVEEKLGATMLYLDKVNPPPPPRPPPGPPGGGPRQGTRFRKNEDIRGTTQPAR